MKILSFIFIAVTATVYPIRIELAVSVGAYVISVLIFAITAVLTILSHYLAPVINSLCGKVSIHLQSSCHSGNL